MDKSVIENRISEIMKAIEQSIAHHNSLLGRLDEAKHILAQVEAAAPVVIDAIEAVEQIAE